MSYRDNARRPSTGQIRSADFFSERPAIIANAIYDTEEAALVLAVSVDVVARARSGEGDKRLRYFQIGTSVRFIGAELLRWIKAHEVQEANGQA